MTPQFPPLRLDYGRRLAMFFIFALVGLFVAAILMALTGALMQFFGFGSASTPATRVGAVIQDFIAFILPTALVAVKVSPRPASLLCVDSLPSPRSIILAVAVMIAYTPLMNFVVEWNQSLSLPSSLSGVEAWMRQSEQAAQTSVGLMLGGPGWGSTIVSVLIVGVLAGLSEEIFFRGGLQRLLASGPIGPHAAIWITATFFSLLHMQFYGFFPRLLLGAFFGYLLYWSGSLWLPVIAHVLNNTIYVLSVRHQFSDAVNSFGASSWPLILFSAVCTALLLFLLSRPSKSQEPSR